MSETSDSPNRLKGYDDFALSLGDELRGERATLGKSLLDVQRDLRIKAAYIAAIENCDPSVFPNQGFIAGYVRSYGRYLKVDPDQMFERFCFESGFEGVNAGMLPNKKGRKSDSRARIKGTEPVPGFTSYGNFQSENILNFISPSGIASATVLVLLIGGLGFGGWSLVSDIQRVEFSPINQNPAASENVVGAENFEIETALQSGSQSAGTIVSFDDQRVLGRLYRPQELAVPKLHPRDGPIASIDPETVGILRPKVSPTRINTTSLTTEFLDATLPPEPTVTVKAPRSIVRLFTTRAAWVRVYSQDGSVLFEKILESGETYTIPADAEKPLLRAGNSGSVYVLVDGVPFGPVGSGTSVAKQISLASIDIKDNLDIADNLDLAPIAETTLSTAGNP